MKVPFVNYPKGYKKYKKEYDEAYFRVMNGGDLILRSDIEKFEEKLAEYVGTKYAVALNSGTDALVLGIQSIAKGLQIFVPCYTFKSTIGAIFTSGNVPILYDLNSQPEGMIGIVAHIAGEIFPLPKTRLVIEDACQALGAVKNPTSIFQTWSFYPAKLLGGFGDNGALTTNNQVIYNYVKEARNHFKTSNLIFGTNSRMDNLQAALLLVKFEHIDEILARRKEIAEMYLKELKKVVLPNNQEGRVWQDFIISTDKRDELYDYLKEQGIETMKNEYPLAFRCPKLPIAQKYESETLRIPCNENLTNKEVEYVITKIKAFYA